MKNQGAYPGEQHHYGQDPQSGKLSNQTRKRGNFWRSATFVMTIIAMLSILTAFVAIKYPRFVGNYPPGTTLAAAPQTGSSANSAAQPVATNAPSSAANPTAQPAATVPSSTLNENILLSCGGCDDPIRVTINTVQVDDANGRMIWNMTLKNVSGNSIGYHFYQYSLVASGSQTQIPASFSPDPGGQLMNDTPYTMQAIFAFVPSQNVSYTFTAELAFNSSGQIHFDPVPITFQ